MLSVKLQTILILQLWNTQIKYGTSFYLQNQKNALNGVNWCEPGVSMVRITTSAHQPVRTEKVRTRANHSCFHGSQRMLIRTCLNLGNPLIYSNSLLERLLFFVLLIFKVCVQNLSSSWTLWPCSCIFFVSLVGCEDDLAALQTINRSSDFESTIQSLRLVWLKLETPHKFKFVGFHLFHFPSL